MKIFLLWHGVSGVAQPLDPDRVSAKLQKIFAPLFATPPVARVRQNSTASLVFLELPVRGWKPPFFQEDEQTWSLALEYPLNARTVLADRGISFETDTVLPTLCRNLQSNATAFLREMAPPFCLIWSSKQTGEVFAQNDGLGLSQLFEYQDDHLWVLTNKIFALPALGVSPEMEGNQWAVRSTLGWFPLDFTGYKRIHFLQPATRVRLDSAGVQRTRDDVLSDWLHPPPISQDECLELARCSLLRQIKAAIPLWERPSAGLTGGWDTRAVLSSLRTLAVDFSVRVKGQPENVDVILATELAKIAGLDLKVKHSAELPPDDVDACQRCIFLGLLWQAGYMVTDKHKAFLATQRHLDGGNVNVMGQHGEIGRGYYTERIRALELSEDQYEERLVDTLMQRMPPFTRQVLHAHVREVIRAAYRQADRYDLLGLARLDFFYLYERTRRWASGSLNSQTGLPISPFLNPDYIRAVFAYRGDDKQTNPFHRHIVAMNAPDWMNVPYEGVLLKEAATRKTELGVSEPRRVSSFRWQQSTGKNYYDSALYWQAVGKPIISEALARGGFWTEVFDPGLTKKEWHAAPDDLAVLHMMTQVLADVA